VALPFRTFPTCRPENLPWKVSLASQLKGEG
jgi:hypothetical protein